jgi:hypothetical protein
MTSKFLTTSLLASALFAALGMAPVMAQHDSGTHAPGAGQAQQGMHTQDAGQAQEAISVRIQRGQASGQITPAEAQALNRREHDIAMRDSRFKADSHVSAQERQQLRADLDGLNAEVDRMLSNRERMHGVNHIESTADIDKRQMEISQRIDEGVRFGHINKRDAGKLREREREIARHEAQAKANGVVTPQEHDQLRNELAALSDEVERMMHTGKPDRRDGR